MAAWTTGHTARRRPPYEPLASDERVDVAVVGGGVTGLACAHALARGSLRVRVLVVRDYLFTARRTEEELRCLIETTVPLAREGSPDEIAAADAFLASDDALLVTSHALVADGGLTAVYATPMAERTETREFKTKSEWAHRRLRKLIGDGELPPGSRLVLRRLADSFRLERDAGPGGALDASAGRPRRLPEPPRRVVSPISREEGVEPSGRGRGAPRRMRFVGPHTSGAPSATSLLEQSF